MARLETDDGGWLELTPVAYQFDDPEGDDPHDRNWLQVAFAAHLGSQLQVRRTVAPALLTWELAGLVTACRLHRSSELPVKALDGLEPNLAIDLLQFREARWTVSVRVAQSFAPMLREPFDKPFEAIVRVRAPALDAFIGALEAELASFPVR